MERGANKGTALKKIQQMLGITYLNTAVFGDNHNDLEMLAEAKYSFAVSNARTRVKELAGYTIDSNNSDGVLKVLNNILRQ